MFSDGAVSLHTRSLKYGKVSWAQHFIPAWSCSPPVLKGSLGGF